MADTLEQIKKTIAEAKDLGIINWNTDTIQFLITTVEQQREEIAGNKQLLGMQKEVIEQLREERKPLHSRSLQT